MMHKAWCSIEEVPYYFSGSSIKFRGHTGWKINDSNPIWVRLLGRSQLSNPSDLPCYLFVFCLDMLIVVELHFRLKSFTSVMQKHHHSFVVIIAVSIHIEGLVQDCSISIADTLEILLSCTKPSISWHLPRTAMRLLVAKECQSWSPSLCHFSAPTPKWAHYRKISNIRRTKSPSLNVSLLVLQLSLPNPMKPGFKSRMKM